MFEGAFDPKWGRVRGRRVVRCPGCGDETGRWTIYSSCPVRRSPFTRRAGQGSGARIADLDVDHRAHEGSR